MALAANRTQSNTLEAALLGNWRIVLSGIFLLSILLFLKTINGGPISDDFQHLDGASIGGGSLAKALTGPFLMDYYRPLTSLSYWIDFHLWPGRLPLWHLHNLILHALTAVLVAVLAKKLTARNDVGALAGLLFAIQPAQCTAVAWVGGRTDVLSALLVTIYLYCLVVYGQSNSQRWLIGSAVALFLACATKEQNAGFLFAGPILLAAQKPKETKKATLASLLALTGFALIWLFLHPTTDPVGSPPIPELIKRLLISPVNYAALIAVPNPYALTANTVIPYAWPCMLLGLTITAATAGALKWAYKTNKIAGALAAVALIAYLPISNLITIPSTPIAPYRIANLGPLIAVLMAWALAHALKKGSRPVVYLFVGNIALSVLMVAWVVKGMQSDADWSLASYKFDPHSRLITRDCARALINDPATAHQGLDILERQLDWIFGNDSWRASADRGIPPTIGTEAQQRLAESEGGVLKPGVAITQYLNLRGLGLNTLGYKLLAYNNFLVGAQLSPATAFRPGLTTLSAQLGLPR